MTSREQIKDEKRKIEEEKRKIEVEKHKIKVEKSKIEDEKRKIEVEKPKIEVEKHKIEVEKHKIKVERSKIEDEKSKIEDEKRKIKDEKRKIKDEKHRAAIKELINTAHIYYQSCPKEVRKAAKKFFEDIDQDHDGKVKLHEFLEFMKQKGYANMRVLFETLDTTRRGTLQFPEVLALFYIILSGRPFCHGCGVFIAGMYFTCSKCYQSDNSNNVIFVCPKCFEKGSYIHHSHERNQFLDNYALLALMGKRGIAWARTHSIQQGQVQQRTPGNAASTSNPHNVLVPHPLPQRKPKLEQFQVLQVLQLLQVVSGLIAHIAGCAIM